MKAIITVIRRTEYSSIVEMTEEEFSKLTHDIDEGTRAEANWAERELNKRIDVKDWQSDEFESLEDFERFEP